MRRIILGSSVAAAAVALVVVGVLWANRHAGSPPTLPPTIPVAEVPDVIDHGATKPALKPAPKREAHLEATWDSKLRFVREVATPGSPPPTNCSIAGRVRLFGANEEAARQLDGVLVITLYDCKPQGGVTEPLPLDEWRIDADTAKSFLTEKATSPEYTFVLPSSGYKPTLTEVRIDVQYEPKTGKPLLAQGDVFTVDHSEMKQQVAP